MLVKLAFAMQRLKKYLKKNFVMINKDGGDTAVMRGDIKLMGVPPVPPTRENPGASSLSSYLNKTVK